MSIQQERATKGGKLFLGPVFIRFNIIQHRIPTVTAWKQTYLVFVRNDFSGVDGNHIVIRNQHFLFISRCGLAHRPTRVEETARDRDNLITVVHN